MELWTIKDGQMALVEIWLGNERGPDTAELYKLPCTVIRHAKNGKSVRVRGDSFGLGCWLPADTFCQPIVSKGCLFAKMDECFESITIDGRKYWKGSFLETYKGKLTVN